MNTKAFDRDSTRMSVRDIIARAGTARTTCRATDIAALRPPLTPLTAADILARTPRWQRSAITAQQLLDHRRDFNLSAIPAFPLSILGADYDQC